METQRVGIVIPAHNRKEKTRECLLSLREQRVRSSAVILVDDGSTDGSALMVKNDFPEVTVLHGNGTLWWAGATNLGLQYLLTHSDDYRFFLLLNNDVVVPPDFLENILESANVHPHSLIGSLCVDSGDLSTILDGGVRINWNTAKYTRLHQYEDYQTMRHRKTEEVDFLTGRGTMIPAGVFRDVGLLDAKRLPQYGADYEFSCRARKAGYRLLVDQRSVVFTEEKQSRLNNGTVAGQGRGSTSLFSMHSPNNLLRRWNFARLSCPPPLLPSFLLLDSARVIGGLVRDELGYHSRRKTENREGGVKVLFITNFCAHYRVKTFDVLSRKIDVEFLFFSKGGERYWDGRHRLKLGKFKGRYLRGVSLLGSRVTPGLPLTIMRKRYDIVIKCIIGRFALPVTYLLARKRGKPFILWMNLWFHPESFAHRMSQPLAKRIYRNADAIVAMGTHVREYLLSQNIDGNKIFLSPQAVDNDLFGHQVTEEMRASLREKFGPDESKIILFVGRLESIKGIEYLIEGFSRCGDTLPSKLIIIGEGREKKGLELLVEKRDLKGKVFFEGYVPNVDLPAYYSIASVLVLPSITLRGAKEVWGLVVNEAMNQGCPVIATESVGAAAGGLVKNGSTGIVIPERDAQAMANAIGTILADEELEHRMRIASLQEIRKWTYDRQVQGFIQAIEHVTRKNVHGS